MSDDTSATRDGARYALFALAMLTVESREAADVARLDARMVKHAGSPSDTATVRPVKR